MGVILHPQVRCAAGHMLATRVDSDMRPMLADQPAAARLWSVRCHHCGRVEWVLVVDVLRAKEERKSA